MLNRHIRLAGVSLIEAALTKLAFDPITAPALGILRGKKKRELSHTPTATAVIPKVVTTPTT